MGHLPREVSRVTKFLLDRGARISLVLSSRHYRRSPLVQGGLEIASCYCQTARNNKESFDNGSISAVLDLYTEPKDEDLF